MNGNKNAKSTGGGGDQHLNFEIQMVNGDISANYGANEQMSVQELNMPPSPQNAEVTETGLKEMKFGKEELSAASKETYFFMKSKFKTSKL